MAKMLMCIVSNHRGTSRHLQRDRLSINPSSLLADSTSGQTRPLALKTSRTSRMHWIRLLGCP